MTMWAHAPESEAVYCRTALRSAATRPGHGLQVRKYGLSPLRTAIRHRYVDQLGIRRSTHEPTSVTRLNGILYRQRR